MKNVRFFLSAKAIKNAEDFHIIPHKFFRYKLFPFGYSSTKARIGQNLTHFPHLMHLSISTTGAA